VTSRYLIEEGIMYYTYAHYTKTTNELFYIGKGRWKNSNDTQRYLQHWNRNKWWKSKVNKHGFNAIILCKFETEKEALEHEKFLITTFKELKFKLVNLTNGGEGSSGRICSKETKEKLSKSHENKKRKISKEEHERLVKLAIEMGKNHKGKKLTKEHKEKISKNHKPAIKIVAFNEKTEIEMCGLADIKSKGFDPSRTYRALREQTMYKSFKFKELK